MNDLFSLLRANPYPGRGIVLGSSADGRHALIAYWIMGRSVNSRNRVFVETADGIRTQAHDSALLTDPSLIIYHPVRLCGGRTIVTNGDQTDTIFDALAAGQDYRAALTARRFEPDAPNFTPRISGVLDNTTGAYSLSILKSDAGDGARCQRFFYEYEPHCGAGHFISTYRGNGTPLPSFSGEPLCVALDGTAQTLADALWNSLDKDNKVSLFVRSLELATGAQETVIVNKHQ